MSFEVVFEKRINNAHVYRDADVGQRRQYFLLTFLAGLFVLALLFYGWQQYRWIDRVTRSKRPRRKRKSFSNTRNGSCWSWALRRAMLALT